MKRRLSSILTLPYKLLVSFLAAYVIYLIIFDFAQTSLIGIILGCAAVVGLYFLIGSYKRVSVDEEWIYISNYFSEERLPLTSIDRVEGPSRWSSIPTIELTFDRPCSFGQTIRFSPRYFEAAEIARELRRANELPENLRQVSLNDNLETSDDKGND